MHRASFLLPFLCVLSFAGAAAAQDPPDRVTFGDDAVVRAGERVHDVVTMGGDATIDGEVTGDVVAMGGSVVVRGTVDGDVVTMGGDLSLADGAVVGGTISTTGGSIDGDGVAGPVVHVARAPDIAVHAPDGPQAALLGLFAAVAGTTASLVRHVLLFLLALLLLGLAPERFGAVQTAIVREPARVGLLGIGAGIGACVVIALLAVTVVGIPAAVLLAVGLGLAGYVGLAAVAGVVGAALPVAWVHGRPVRELAAGTLVLFLATLVPLAGTLAVLVAGCVGLGAVVLTRFAKVAPRAGAPLGAGPFRTMATG